jgi:hypothetical protein
MVESSVRRVALVLASALVALAAACAGTPGGGEDPAGQSGADEALSVAADVTCASADGTMTFLLPATSAGHVNGQLKTSEGISLFSCRNPAAGAVATGAVANCTEREQSLHDGSDKVVVTKSADAFEAVLTTPGDAGASVALTCTTRDGAAMAAAAPAPKFSDVETIIQNTCTRCHSNEFSTLSKVREKRMRMLSKVSSGEMPRGNPTFKDTPDGQTLLSYLTTSADLP